MKKTLFAAIVAAPALFALPAGAAADSPGRFTVVVNPVAASYGIPSYGRPAPRYRYTYGRHGWRPLPRHFNARQRFHPRFGHRVVRPYRPHRSYRPYRFVFRFD